MSSFAEIIKEEEKQHAYWLGSREFYRYLLSKELPPKLLLSPFEPDTKEDKEWHDGYLDTMFIHYGVLEIG